jgi:hypothetical protein
MGRVENKRRGENVRFEDFERRREIGGLEIGALGAFLPFYLTPHWTGPFLIVPFPD